MLFPTLFDKRLPERFWDKVQPEPNSGCWLWMASLQNRGYGQFRFNGTMRLAHRVAYQALVGEVPADLECDHLCRTRCCVNPAHLEPITGKENAHRSPLHHANRTHCAAGHEYSADNTHWQPRGNRVCKTCNRERARRRRERTVK